MSLKVKQTENGFIITEIEFQKKQKTWVCNSSEELASFMLGYYETDGIYAEEDEDDVDEDAGYDAYKEELAGMNDYIKEKEKDNG
jgi:hypothetical protein